ncbi:unnamed protein product, partial [Didymodactylos carnosus]
MALATSPRRDTSRQLRPTGLETDGFTVKSLLKNAKVTPPKNSGATTIRPSKPTAFRKFYERGDFPIALEHDTKGNKIAWKVEI